MIIELLPSSFIIMVTEKGPVYLVSIGEYLKPDTPKNLTWRIIAKGAN